MKLLRHPAPLASRLPLLPFAAAGLILSNGVPLQAGVELTDDFASFTLGETWQVHGAGVPEVALSVVGGIGTDGSSLRMGTAPGEDDIGTPDFTPTTRDPYLFDFIIGFA